MSKENSSSDLNKDLSNLLKEEGSFVKDLTSVATKAAEFHARLESIEKALASDSSTYSSKEADEVAQKARDKYSSELEGQMKDQATEHLSYF